MRQVMYYLLLTNGIGILCMYLDKKRAIKRQYRISERILLGLSVIGASLGILFGMYTFHHKTKKPSFKYGVPIIFVMQIVLYIVYAFNK